MRKKSACIFIPPYLDKADKQELHKAFTNAIKNGGYSNKGKPAKVKEQHYKNPDHVHGFKVSFEPDATHTNSTLAKAVKNTVEHLSTKPGLNALHIEATPDDSVKGKVKITISSKAAILSQLPGIELAKTMCFGDTTYNVSTSWKGNDSDLHDAIKREGGRVVTVTPDAPVEVSLRNLAQTPVANRPKWIIFDVNQTLAVTKAHQDGGDTPDKHVTSETVSLLQQLYTEDPDLQIIYATGASTIKPPIAHSLIHEIDPKLERITLFTDACENTTADYREKMS